MSGRHTEVVNSEVPRNGTVANSGEFLEDYLGKKHNNQQEPEKQK